jgi:hypothetical protein
MKIAFHSNQLCLRGTEVALYDYAKYNEELLGNNSIIISRHSDIQKLSHPQVVEKFQKRFPVYLYHNFNEIEKILDDNNVDVFYAIKAGFNDGVISKGRKSVNHVVFQHHDPHGNVYAYVSEWLGRRFNSPFVPHMVTLPDINDDLRNELNIPKNAIVFGRHGGAETFDIPFAHNVVKRIATSRNDIYFLFLFTNRFTDSSLKNVIYLEGSEDMIYKTKFINTCDAMLHARYAGESFGLSVGEFSIRNKPIITLKNGSRDCAHIEMLGSKGIYYNNENELYNILNNFIPDNTKDYWNVYSQFNPENVMNKFKQVFLT